MKSLFYRLITLLDYANENDTNYTIALYMATHFSALSHMGIAELAKACYVSPATISRFCRTLGYDSFATLKLDCEVLQKNMIRSNNLASVDMIDMLNDPQKACREYTHQLALQMDDMSKHLDWKVIDIVLKLIHDAPNVYFFGTHFSHSAAVHLQTDLMMLEKFSLAYSTWEQQLEASLKMNEEDLAILISVNGNYIQSASQVLRNLKKRGCRTVLITQNNVMPVIKDCDYIIYLGDTNFGKMGKHNLLTLMELMATRYFVLFSHQKGNELCEN